MLNKYSYWFDRFSAVIFVTLLLLLATTSHSVRAEKNKPLSKIAEQEAELNRLKKEIAAKKKKAAIFKKKEQGEVKKLNRIDTHLESVSRQLNRLRNDEKRVSSALITKDNDLKRTTSELVELRAEFGARLREMYKRTVYRDVEWLLVADSFPFFLRNLKYLNRIAQRNRKKFLSIVSYTKSLASDKYALEHEFAEKQRIKKQQEKLGSKYRFELKKRKKVLAKIKNKRTFYEQAVQESEERYKAIQNLIDELEHTRHSSGAAYHTSFSRARGSMSWPVTGRVVKKFGKHKHPRHGTITFNKGIDIKVSGGKNIRTVWQGRAAVVNWIRGYGKFVVLDHGNGYYSLYAHLNDVFISQGSTIDRGEILGTTGGTGALQGDVFHFEIRKGRKVVNPLLWLKK